MAAQRRVGALFEGVARYGSPPESGAPSKTRKVSRGSGPLRGKPRGRHRPFARQSAAATYCGRGRLRRLRIAGTGGKREGAVAERVLADAVAMPGEPSRSFGSAAARRRAV